MSETEVCCALAMTCMVRLQRCLLLALVFVDLGRFAGLTRAAGLSTRMLLSMFGMQLG